MPILSDPSPLVEPACRSLAGWIEDQASRYRSPAQRDEARTAEDERRLDLVAATLEELALDVEFTTLRPGGAGALARALSVTHVAVPDRRDSPLAEALDAEARGFLAVGSDAGNLCAAAIVQIADDVEQLVGECGTSVDDYRAAARERDERERRTNEAAVRAAYRVQ